MAGRGGRGRGAGRGVQAQRPVPGRRAAGRPAGRLLGGADGRSGDPRDVPQPDRHRGGLRRPGRADRPARGQLRGRLHRLAGHQPRGRQQGLGPGARPPPPGRRADGHGGRGRPAQRHRDAAVGGAGCGDGQRPGRGQGDRRRGCPRRGARRPGADPAVPVRTRTHRASHAANRRKCGGHLPVERRFRAHAAPGATMRESCRS